MTAIFSIVRFVLVAGGNMNEGNSYLMSAYLLAFSDALKLIFVNNLVNTFISLWHEDITHAKTVLSWLLLKFKKWSNIRKTEHSQISVYQGNVSREYHCKKGA